MWVALTLHPHVIVSLKMLAYFMIVEYLLKFYICSFAYVALLALTFQGWELRLLILNLSFSNICNTLVLCVEVVLMGYTWISISGDPHGKMRFSRKLYFCRIIPLSFQTPIFLSPVRKKYSWGFSRAKTRASVQSSLSMLEPCPLHQTSCSPLVHCVWDLYVCGP